MQQFGALAHARQADVTGLVRSERIDVAEALAVVGHPEHRIVGLALEGHVDALALAVLAGVRDRLLRDAEKVVGYGWLQLDVAVHCHSAAVAAAPHRDAALDRDLERDLLEGVRAEADDLVAERMDVALGRSEERR